MDRIWIRGGSPLCGETTIQGSKNAALPILAACILVSGVTTLINCPEISDVACMCEILKRVGVKIKRQDDRLYLDASVISDTRLPEEYVTRMRSSVILAGAMLARCREISLSYPGGCVIGDRPIDMHMEALERLGAVFTEEEGRLNARTGQLTGAAIRLAFPSVGATQNAVLAAVLAEGVTEIYNSAREPEVQALCRFLNGAGARIRGIGTAHLIVEGVTKLRETTWRIEPDRIVAGTYLTAVLAAGGRAFLRQVPEDQLTAVCRLAQQMGAVLTPDAAGLLVEQKGRVHSPGQLCTGVYPAFPTDLQSPFLVALCQADGPSRVQERIFNGRFGVAGQLNRMGAGIELSGNEAVLPGGRQLMAAEVTARELRGGAALVLAGICARGETRVENRHFVDRGYADIVGDLRKLGADIGSETKL